MILRGDGFLRLLNLINSSLSELSMSTESTRGGQLIVVYVYYNIASFVELYWTLRGKHLHSTHKTTAIRAQTATQNPCLLRVEVDTVHLLRHLPHVHLVVLRPSLRLLELELRLLLGVQTPVPGSHLYIYLFYCSINIREMREMHAPVSSVHGMAPATGLGPGHGTRSRH